MTMKCALTLLALCLALSSAAAGPAVKERRFLLDSLANVAHAVLDPLAGTVINAVHLLVGEFDYLVNGHVGINTVVCKLPTETTGSRDEKIATCTATCLADATHFLGEEAAETAPNSCPVACKYAYDHPTHVSC